MQIFTVVLRRSGSTIFWKVLRQDSRLLCFDEPFNPLLKELPVEHPKQTRGEFINLYQADPEKFKKMYAPIIPEQEAEDSLREEQKSYAKWLLSQNENVVLESVRCSFKVPELFNIAPDAFLIHLYRSPAAFVSSHLIPTGGTGSIRNRLATFLRKKSFWFRRNWYNNYHYEDIIDRIGKKAFSTQLQKVGLDPELVYSLPAAGKLMALWKTSYERIQRDGQRLFGQNFLSVKFERFCRDPEATFKKIYEVLGLDYPGFDFSAVHSARPGFQPESPRWKRLCERVGMSTNELAEDVA